MQESNDGPKKDDRVYDFSIISRRDYLREIGSRSFMITRGVSGWARNLTPESIDDDYVLIRILLRTWLGDFAASEPDHEKGLSAEQKKHIISSLEGSCVQEDWDVLKARLPQLTAEYMMEVLLEALMFKDIRTRFFENPFWYFDGKKGPSDQTGDNDFSAALQYLYERYSKSKWLPRYIACRCFYTNYTYFAWQQTKVLQKAGEPKLFALPIRSINCREMTMN